ELFHSRHMRSRSSAYDSVRGETSGGCKGGIRQKRWCGFHGRRRTEDRQQIMNIDLIPIINKAVTQDFMKGGVSHYEDNLVNAFVLSKTDAEQKTFRDMRSFLEGSLDPESNHLFFVRETATGEYVGAIWLVTEADVRIA